MQRPPSKHCSKPALPPCGGKPPGDCKVSPPKKRTEILRDKTPEPIIKKCVTRLPTPEPDVIEKVIVRRQPQVILECVYEQPNKPPPIIKYRCEYEPAPEIIVKKHCIFVEPTPRCCPQPKPPKCCPQYGPSDFATVDVNFNYDSDYE